MIILWSVAFSICLQKIISFWSICNWYYRIMYFMRKVSQKWSQNYKDGAGNKKNILFISMNPLLSHIFLFGLRTKFLRTKCHSFCHSLLKILVTFISLMINKPLENSISLENWKNCQRDYIWLKNKIIPLVSQKRSRRFGEKNVPQNSYNLF